jgi:hypothetical protein
MPHHGRHAAHELVLDVTRPDVALRVDEVGPDDELLRFLVDHPVGVRAADALRPHVEAHVRPDSVELVATTLGGVRWVGEKPEPACPGHDGTDAALAVARERACAVERRQMRIDPADLQRRGGRRFGLNVPLDRRLANGLDRGCPEGKADCGSRAAASEKAVALMIGHASVSREQSGGLGRSVDPCRVDRASGIGKD